MWWSTSAMTRFEAMPSGANSAYLSLLAAAADASANQKNSALSACGLKYLLALLHRFPLLGFY